jgi:hypothetical protein
MEYSSANPNLPRAPRMTGTGQCTAFLRRTSEVRIYEPLLRLALQHEELRRWLIDGRSPMPRDKKGGFGVIMQQLRPKGDASAEFAAHCEEFMQILDNSYSREAPVAFQAQSLRIPTALWSSSDDKALLNCLPGWVALWHDNIALQHRDEGHHRQASSSSPGTRHSASQIEVKRELPRRSHSRPTSPRSSAAVGQAEKRPRLDYEPAARVSSSQSQESFVHQQAATPAPIGPSSGPSPGASHCFSARTAALSLEPPPSPSPRHLQVWHELEKPTDQH